MIYQFRRARDEVPNYQSKIINHEFERAALVSANRVANLRAEAVKLINIFSAARRTAINHQSSMPLWT